MKWKPFSQSAQAAVQSSHLICFQEQIWLLLSCCALNRWTATGNFNTLSAPCALHDYRFRLIQFFRLTFRLIFLTVNPTSFFFCFFYLIIKIQGTVFKEIWVKSYSDDFKLWTLSLLTKICSCCKNVNWKLNRIFLVSATNHNWRIIFFSVFYENGCLSICMQWSADSHPKFVFAMCFTMNQNSPNQLESVVPLPKNMSLVYQINVKKSIRS